MLGASRTEETALKLLSVVKSSQLVMYFDLVLPDIHV